MMKLVLRPLAGLLAFSPLLACSAEATDEAAGAVQAQSVAAVQTGAKGASQPAMLPERLLECNLGHIVNFDIDKRQTAAELRFDTIHEFSLKLSAIPVRTTLPPDPIEEPEPVNPITRIISDPDNIGKQLTPAFNRVVDYWPERVELGGIVRDDILNIIVITGFNPATGTADLFMTQGSELTRFDTNSMYQGMCKVTIGSAL